MKKAVWISLVTLAVLGIGIAAWFFFGGLLQKGSSTVNTEIPMVERTDFTNDEHPQVSIRDLSFTPPNIKVKRGTTVTWTNKDTVGHSLVAEDVANPGGFPTISQTFGKDETDQVMFNEIGLYRYYCGPHTFMRGSVEVVE